MEWRCWTLAEQSYKWHSLVSFLHAACNAWWNAIITFFSHSTPPNLTRKVIQNTRPSFSHVQGGSGHETILVHLSAVYRDSIVNYKLNGPNELTAVLSSTLTSIKFKQSLGTLPTMLWKSAFCSASTWYFRIDVVDVEFCDAHSVITNMCDFPWIYDQVSGRNDEGFTSIILGVHRHS